MRLDRGLRSAMMKPYPLGFVAIPTDDVNEESPNCQLGGIKDAGVWLLEQTLPSVIEIQVSLIPIWVDNEVSFARLNENESCPLYPAHTVFSAVRVEATGIGNYQKASGEDKVPFVGTRFLHYRLDLPKPYIYQKEFLVQPQGRHIYSSSQKASCLWAYGARQVGDDIHPLVCTLEALRGETILHLTSLQFWRERGIFLNRESNQEEVIFADIFEEDQTRTLLESIEAGMSLINLEVGIDEEGTPLMVPYYSYQLSKNFLFYKRGE